MYKEAINMAYKPQYLGSHNMQCVLLRKGRIKIDTAVLFFCDPFLLERPLIGTILSFQIFV